MHDLCRWFGKAIYCDSVGCEVPETVGPRHFSLLRMGWGVLASATAAPGLAVGVFSPCRSEWFVNQKHKLCAGWGFQNMSLTVTVYCIVLLTWAILGRFLKWV
jgi:hypothetical protein